MSDTTLKSTLTSDEIASLVAMFNRSEYDFQIVISGENIRVETGSRTGSLLGALSKGVAGGRWLACEVSWTGGSGDMAGAMYAASAHLQAVTLASMLDTLLPVGTPVSTPVDRTLLATEQELARNAKLPF